MTMSERVKALQFPLDEVVVIGSGLLDQLGLRAANDIDLAVSPSLFERLDQDSRFQRCHDERGIFYTAKNVEIWPDWSPQSYDHLRAEARQLDGVWYVAPEYLIQKKQVRGTEKDLADIQLLQNSSKIMDRI